MIIKKDTIILFSSGEYSDYNIKCLCKATEDIDYDAIRDEFATRYPEQVIGRYHFKDEDFMNLLKEKNFLEEVQFSEWYLESYSTFSEMQVTDKGPLLFT